MGLIKLPWWDWDETITVKNVTEAGGGGGGEKVYRQWNTHKYSLLPKQQLSAVFGAVLPKVHLPPPLFNLYSLCQ